MKPFSVLVFLSLTVSVFGQHLPRVDTECRSEMDERLAFGLCDDGRFDFFASGTYKEGIPTPEEFFGYPIGSWHTTYGRMERYIHALQESAPNRVFIELYGKSIEQQNMMMLVISSESNIKNLEQIRLQIQRLANPEKTNANAAKRLAATTPAIVWLNPANDGNETAAFEACLQIAYQLAAGEDARTQNLRTNSVTLINFAHNPESHERHVAWYNAFVKGDPDPSAMEHRAPWGMSTNNNHYQMDLNRDALGLTQTETRAVSGALLRWRPQIFVDLHGQTVQYFFPPTAIPMNPIFPEQMDAWTEIIGRANAEAFDQHGWSYFVRDIFDFHYPGYWDTYPSLHGATGMTYETDGGGWKGVRLKRDDDTILSFSDGIAHHFVTSLATIEVAANHRSERLMDYYRFFKSALDLSKKDPVKQVFLLPGKDTRKANALATLLLRHDIEVSQITKKYTIRGFDMATGKSGPFEVPIGSYVVNYSGKNYRVIKTFLDRDIPVQDAFVSQELKKMLANTLKSPQEKQRHAFYDVTAWNLPLAMGVKAYWTKSKAVVSAEKLSIKPDFFTAPGGWKNETMSQNGGTNGTARSAYIWEPYSEGSGRLVSKLIGEGFKIAVTTRPMMAGEKSFPAGSFIARVGRNSDNLHSRIDALGKDAGVSIYAAQTAFPDAGPSGTGSPAARTIQAPKVAVLAGGDVDDRSYGSIWFHLEQRIAYPFTTLDVSNVGETDISDYDIIILPSGEYSGVSEDEVSKIGDWIKEGGNVIAIGKAAHYLRNSDIFDEDEETDDADPDSAGAIRESIAKSLDVEINDTFESPSAETNKPLPVPGSFLMADFDQSHWLTFGIEPKSMPVFTRNLPLELSEDGISPVRFSKEDDFVVSGFSWPENTDRHYPGKALATVDKIGDGKIILISENPVYRATYTATSQLLFNAIFFSATLR